MLKARDVVIYFALKYQGDWDAIYQAIRQKEAIDDEELTSLLARHHAKTLTIVDDEYPEKLKMAIKPPFALFYYGHLELLHEPRMIAVIGSRTASDYGKEATTKLVGQMVDKNITIISGLALGIDGVAHMSAMQKQGKTIAVLGSGIDKCYPASNRNIYNEMCLHQLVLSEYPFDVSPNKENFPIRNRIIAALADNIVVTEAYAKSGTLITVNLALQLNKDVYCVPYPFQASSLNNRLIKEGAMLIESLDDMDL